MTEPVHRPRKLDRQVHLSEFNCGAAELDVWLQRFAWENQRANNAVTYVATMGTRVVGYYAIATGAVELVDVPPPLKRGTRPDPMPVIVLARLAVDRSVTGRGIGAGLLRDALERCALLSESIGAAALLIHARDSQARDFYLKLGDFVASPASELQLMVSMKELRAQFLA